MMEVVRADELMVKEFEDSMEKRHTRIAGDANLIISAILVKPNQSNE